MELLDDNIILSLMQDENPAGYRALFDKYYKSLCIQACLLLHNGEEAEDLVQDIFVRFWQEKKYLQVQQSLGAYLSVSVKNRSINLIKQKKRFTVVGEEFYADQPESSEILNHMEIREIGKALDEALDELPEQCRKIFEMVCVDGKRYKEASEIAGVSVNTVKTQLRRAFSRLREQLAEIRYFTIDMSPILHIFLSLTIKTALF